MEEVYKNIKKRRLELGMTQKELARLAGYENRSSIPSISQRKKPCVSRAYMAEREGFEPFIIVYSRERQTPTIAPKR